MFRENMVRVHHYKYSDERSTGPPHPGFFLMSIYEQQMRGCARQEHWSGLPFPSPIRESET